MFGFKLVEIARRFNGRSGRREQCLPEPSPVGSFRRGDKTSDVALEIGDAGPMLGKLIERIDDDFFAGFRIRQTDIFNPVGA